MTNRTPRTQYVAVRVPVDLLERIDALRASRPRHTPRSRIIVEALQAALTPSRAAGAAK